MQAQAAVSCCCISSQLSTLPLTGQLLSSSSPYTCLSPDQGLARYECRSASLRLMRSISNNMVQSAIFHASTCYSCLAACPDISYRQKVLSASPVDRRQHLLQKQFAGCFRLPCQLTSDLWKLVTLPKQACKALSIHSVHAGEGTYQVDIDCASHGNPGQCVLPVKGDKSGIRTDGVYRK